MQKVEIGNWQMHSQYKCNKCKDIKYIFNEDGSIKMCTCLIEERRRTELKTCNVSDEVYKKSFELFEEDVDKEIVKIKKICIEYSQGLINFYKKNNTLVNTPSLGICGASGIGKTHLITAIAKELLEKTDIIPYFFNWVSSFKEWFSYYNSKDIEKVNKIREKLMNTEILIIDDLCKDFGVKETWISEFYAILDYRYRKNKPIIFTSEHYSELVVMLSEAVFGRLYEMTENKKLKKHYFMKCFLGKNDDVFKLNYRLRNLRKGK